MSHAAAFADSTAGRADCWQLARTRLDLTQRPLVMGIVNVTPDSFSDGGKFFDVRSAIDQCFRLADAGADLLDIGGESTRPYAATVDVGEELRRVLPVLEAVCPKAGVPVSIDTSKAVVARAALETGAEIINDVTALTGDEALLELAVKSGAGVCAMHMQGTPRTMQLAPHYDDVVAEVWQFLAARRAALLAAGIAPQNLALDPGIGFGKTHAHNLALLRGVGRFHGLHAPLLLGHSRKGFVGHALRAAALTDDDPARAAGTVGVSLWLAQQGVQVLRVHDVALTRQALALFQALGGLPS